MNNILKYLPHYLRKRFDEKYIIIESDDWGMERAPCIGSLEWMRKKYGEGNFTRWSTDSLETKEDLNLMFDLLESYRNKFEEPPVITANFITHNIDYSKNGNLDFIPVSKGFNEYSEDVRSLYKEGIEKKYIFPQLHGYSHYNLKELEKYYGTSEGSESAEQKFLTARSTIMRDTYYLIIVTVDVMVAIIV